jgi:hypothetical protein
LQIYCKTSRRHVLTSPITLVHPVSNTFAVTHILADKFTASWQLHLILPGPFFVLLRKSLSMRGNQATGMAGGKRAFWPPTFDYKNQLTLSSSSTTPHAVHLRRLQEALQDQLEENIILSVQSRAKSFVVKSNNCISFMETAQASLLKQNPEVRRLIEELTDLRDEIRTSGLCGTDWPSREGLETKILA